MALYVVLSKFTIPIDALGVRITFASLPLVVSALFFPPIDSVIVGGLGELLVQLTGQYGLSVTTPLWLLPPMIRCLTIAIPAYLYRKKEDRLEKHIVLYFTVIMSAALLTTLANTGVWFLDAMIMEYPYPYTIISTVIRGAIGLATALVIGGVCLPVARAVQHAYK